MAEPRTLFHGGRVFDAASASLAAADVVVADGRVLERYPHATLAVIEDAGTRSCTSNPNYSPRSSATGSIELDQK